MKDFENGWNPTNFNYSYDNHHDNNIPFECITNIEGKTIAFKAAEDIPLPNEGPPYSIDYVLVEGCTAWTTK